MIHRSLDVVPDGMAQTAARKFGEVVNISQCSIVLNKFIDPIKNITEGITNGR